MNRALLSLCLLGAGLATANILIMERPTCPSSGADVVSAYKEISATQGSPAQTPKKVGAHKPAQAPTANPAREKPEPAAALKDLDRTGSVSQKTKKPNGEKSAPVSQPAPAEVRNRQAGLYKRRYEPRRYDWRRHYRYLGPPVGFAIRVYPGW